MVKVWFPRRGPIRHSKDQTISLERLQFGTDWRRHDRLYVYRTDGQTATLSVPRRPGSARPAYQPLGERNSYHMDREFAAATIRQMRKAVS